MAASIALLLLLARLPPASDAWMAPRNEAQAIAAAMLGYENAAYPSAPSERTCVTPSFSAPLRLVREDRDDREREARAHRQASNFEVRLDWVLPEPRPDPNSPLLDDTRARQLDHMVGAALDAFSPRAAFVRRVPRGAVPPPLLLGPQPHCPYSISMSAPFIVGEIAFIEGNYESGGNIYALERRDGRWTVFALANMWIF